MSVLALLAAALNRSYVVGRELGAGGMATVYLARDIKHDRDVAIKVLHPDLGAALGAERFLAEIKTTARLQHPHILPLLDSGDADGLLYYVMPLVTGETLRARLSREQQLPIADALTITREVADALGYAHSLGVIHRDIKPENILLQGGHALVADFGIALAVQSAGGLRMTQTGLSLGTPQYMSPEQAMGEKTLDARSDIYALGAVAYEMLTGEPPFTGPNVQAIVAKVLSSQPEPLTTIRKSVPAHVADAVHTAIEKLPADRFATAADFVQALRNDSGASRPARQVIPQQPRARLAISALSVLCVALASLAAWLSARAPAEATTTRAFLRFPPAESPHATKASSAILPDGSAIVYVGTAGDSTQLWIRKRNELHATPIGGTVGAGSVFVSSDGAWIGFFIGARVLKVPVTGGSPVVVDNAPCTNDICASIGGAFLDDGRVVHNAGAGILLSRTDGGVGDSLVTSRMVGGFSAVQPSVLPGSRGVLFTACTIYCNRSDVWVIDFATPNKPRKLIDFASNPLYLPTGHLLYVDAKGAVFARRFDLKSMTVSGDAVQVLEHSVGALSVSEHGTLLYADGDATPRSQLMLVARDGTAQPLDTSWRGNFASVALSPDGSRVVASIVHNNGEEHLWAKALSAGAPARLTFAAGQHTAPTWSADGRSVLYNRFALDSNWLMSRPADGSGQEAILQHGPSWVVETTVSRDGVWRIQREYHRNDGSRDIFARRTAGDTTLRTVVTSADAKFSPALSPDGRWLAYTSEADGTLDVWVVPFPDANGRKYQISVKGGTEPLWSRDGRELYYVNMSGSLTAVSVSGTTTLAVGEHQTLFSLAPYRRFDSHRAYDVRPGNAGFVMIRDGSPTSTNLVLVDNWFTELRAKLK